MCSTAQDLLDRLGDDLSQLGETAAVERGAAGVGDRISALLAARAKVEALVFAISNDPLDIGSATIKVGVTAGLAMIRPQDTVMSVLSRADKAMYAQRSAR